MLTLPVWDILCPVLNQVQQLVYFKNQTT